MAWQDTWSEITNHPEWRDLPADVQLKVSRNFAKKVVGPETGKKSDAYKGFIQDNIISRTTRQGGTRQGSVGAGFAEGFNRNLAGLATQATTGRKALREEGSAIANNPMSILKETVGGIAGELVDPIGLAVDVVTGGIGGKLVSRAARPAVQKAITIGAGATSGATQGAASAALQGQVNGQVNAGDVARTSALGALLGGAIPAAVGRRASRPIMEEADQVRIPPMPPALPPTPLEAQMMAAGLSPEQRAAVLANAQNPSQAPAPLQLPERSQINVPPGGFRTAPDAMTDQFPRVEFNSQAPQPPQSYRAGNPMPNLGRGSEYVGPAVQIPGPVPPAPGPAYPATGMLGAAGDSPTPTGAELSLLRQLLPQRQDPIPRVSDQARPVAGLEALRRSPASDPLDLLRMDAMGIGKRQPMALPPSPLEAQMIEAGLPAEVRAQVLQASQNPPAPRQPLALPERVPIRVPEGGFRDPSAALTQQVAQPPINHQRMADELSFAADVAANAGNDQALTKIVQAMDALGRHQAGERALPVERMVQEAIQAVNPTRPAREAGTVAEAAPARTSASSTKGLVRSDAIYTHQANKAIEAEAAAIERMKPQLQQEIGQRLSQAMANRDLESASQLARLGRAVDGAAWANQLKDIRNVLDGDTDQSLLARIFRDEEGALDLEAMRTTARNVRNRLGRVVDEVGGRAILGQIDGINPSDAAAFVGPGAKNLRGEAKKAVEEFTQKERPRATTMPHAIEGVDPEDFLNFSKFAISEGEASNLARLVQQSVAETQGNPKRAVTFDEIKAEAAKVDPRLIAELRPPKDGHTIHPAVRQAARDRLNAINGEAYRRSVELEKVRHTMTEAEARAEESVIHRLERDAKGIIDVLYPARSQDGRNLAYHRMTASNSFDAEYWVSRAKRAAGGALPDDKLRAVRDLIAQGAEAQAKGDQAGVDNARFGLAKELMKLEKTGPLETVLALRKAGLLSSVKTHTRNVLGNASFAALEEIRRVPSALVDMAMAAATGNRTVAGPSGKAIWRSTYEAATRGVKEAKEVLRHGATYDDLVNLKLGREVNSGNKILDAYANFLFRSLSAEDRVFKAYAWRRSIEAQAKLKAINEGLKGEAARKAAKEYSEKPSSEMIAQAIADSEVATFTNENPVAKGIQRLESVSPAMRAGVDLLVPFKNTPLNIVARILDYTGAGAAVEGGKIVANRLKAEKALEALKPEEQRAIADALGRGLTGWGAILLGYKLAEAGVMTGSFQPEKDKRNVDDVAGRSPAAIKIGGSWQQIGALAPLGNLLTIGATLHRDGGGVIGAAAIGAKTAMEQPFFQGLEQVTKVAQDPAEETPKLVGDLAGSFVPTFVNDAATALDDTKREAKTPVERIQNRIPGLRNQLPAKVDALGREVPQDRLHAINAFLSREAREDSDPIVRELLRLDVGLSPVGKQISIRGEAVKLSDPQIRELTRLTGEFVQQQLGKVVERPAYQRYDDERKKAVLEKVITNARAQARRQMLRTIAKQK